ncbi:MAG: hypothetical protein J6A19_11180 [Oscillospiraceae bacterium]|nr:hypothetical protein [Oscillospiraceae bacterium]
MKLSKQERIAVLVIAVIILLTLGVIFFIVPKFNAIGTDSALLLNKQAELKTAQDRAATKDDLQDQIINAYNDGRNIADMFFEEMQPYEADNEIREFIEYCNNSTDENVKVAVTVDSLSIGSPSVSTLGVSFFTEPVVTYDLKTYVTQGQQPTEDELAAAAREILLQSALSSTQTVGSIDVTFDVTALSDDDLLKFVDDINNYIKNENGKDVRKAMRLSSGYSVSYSEIEEKYTKLADEFTEKAVAEANKLLGIDGKDDTNAAGNADTDNAAGNNGAEQEDKDDKDKSIDDVTREMTVTITMYSIERMQDPTDQLAAQNAM